MIDFSTRPRRRVWTGDGALLAAAVVAFVAAALLCWRASSELDRRREEVARAAREADDVAQRADAAEKRRAPASAVLVAQVRESAEAPPPKIVAELSALLPPEVRLQALDLDYRERLVVDLRVVARRAEAYDLFLARLAGSPRFADVVPGPENRQGELAASVRMTYRSAEP
jgi:hypothetical protein